MWVYQQSTGYLFNDHGLLGQGYSGNSRGLNNPDMQQVPDVGPIPCGEWYMEAAIEHTEHGPVTIPLTPEPGTETYGREGFLVHGDLKEQAGQYLASKGCVILPRW